jgi:hypothetical protein
MQWLSAAARLVVPDHVWTIDLRGESQDLAAEALFTAMLSGCHHGVRD